MATGKEVKEGYASTLQDLTFNSKPLINVLTMLAEENSLHAKEIVEVIETYLTKVRVEVKLPVLYLIDCIMKNVGGPYTALFCQNIVSMFCTVFEMVDEKTRAEMFKLRQTWNDVIPQKKLYALDVQINCLDPAWPVTAPPPASSIHFNPKFLKSTNTPQIKKDIPKPVDSTNLLTNQTNLDPVTLDMQKLLLIKQQELLELQQKKIKLELLQTQVKLQEQLKNKTSTDKLNESQNILLKPEVAKQLVNMTPTTVQNSTVTTSKSKLHSSMGTSMKSKLQNSSGNTVTKINPVSSGMVASAKPIRDPRLLKQQATVNTNNINSNLSIENKPLPPPSTDNKVIVNNSKMSVRENRSEPRLVNNKDTIPPEQGKAKALPRIPLKSNTTKNTDSHKSQKSSRSSKSSNNSGVSSKSSSSSLESPSKKASDGSPKNRSPTKSPSKHKKKESPSKLDGKKSDKTVKHSKSDKDKQSKSDSSDIVFKDVKVKNRNYIRRNRLHSVSPEPNHDVDLRLGAPPEKFPRIQGEPNQTTVTEQLDSAAKSGMDVDLRQLPEIISKKRSSTEVPEASNPKKSKTEIFDALFGNEDTDLRQLNVMLSPSKLQEKPTTPPPPIISNKVQSSNENGKESKKANLDIVRAKLANATNKFPKNIPNHEDVDFRSTNAFPNTFENKINSKIIISPDDEQSIKTGTMTKAQEAALISKIFAQMENQKLLEAKRKEKSEIEKLANTSLQPISDEELDDEASDDDRKNKNSKDLRLPPPPPQLGEFNKYSRGNNDQRRPPMTWRGRRGRIPGGTQPRPPIRGGRVGPDPWARPMGPWRPMAPTFNKGSIDSFGNNSPLDDGLSNDIGSNSPNAFENNQESPNLVMTSVNQDDIKSINIDGIPRDIRYYDETAIAFMNWDDPREITFHNGTRRVIFDEKESFILSFNEPYRDIIVNGNPHKIKLGGPTRELYIDGKWYECYFGGPGIGVELDGKVTVVKMEGPPPQVKIGTVTRSDLVGGKINLIIDAKNVVPIFLDAKVQKFEVEGKTHTLQFTDALRTVLINDTPYNVEFGGLPKPVTVNNKKHFIRFSVLPKGIKPGYVNIKDLKGSRMSSPILLDENSQESQTIVEINTNEPALPVIKKKKVPVGALSPDQNSNPTFALQNILQQQNLNHLDVLSSVMTSSLNSNSNMSAYTIANNAQSETGNSKETGSLQKTSTTSPTNSQPFSFNINELFQKLVATGIVATSTTKEQQPAASAQQSQDYQPQLKPNLSKNFMHKNLKPVYFDKPETLKLRQPVLIQILHSGMQCSSCGMRFPPEHSMQYSQHLDWHFRQNRKGKKNIRKAASRRWYYNLADWKNYEEVEDLEEREKSYFDQQQSTEGGVEDAEEEIEIPSVVADPNITDARCEVCQDRFEQFYNEEKEEWHLRMAIRVDGKTYHPLCYEDFQASLNETNESGIPGLEVISTVDEIINEKEKIEDEIIIDDDEEVVNKDDVTPSPKSDVEKSDEKIEENDDDDDVIIHEVIPERIILDDDDKDDEITESIAPTKIVVKEEPLDDGFIDVEGGVLKFNEIKIKTEPIDIDDSGLVPPSEEELKTSTDTTYADVVPLIDGNVQFESGLPPTSSVSGKIKINITKPLPVLAPKEINNKDLVSSDVENNSAELIDPSQPLPPGEESIQLNLKPALQGLNVKKLPPVQKGTELTGLCSIM